MTQPERTPNYMEVIDDRDGTRVYFLGQLFAFHPGGESYPVPHIVIACTSENASPRKFCDVCGTLFPLIANQCPHCTEDDLQQADAFTRHDKLLAALQELYRSFQHREGNTKGNQAKTDIIKYNDDVKDALNSARIALGKEKTS